MLVMITYEVAPVERHQIQHVYTLIVLLFTTETAKLGHSLTHV